LSNTFTSNITIPFYYNLVKKKGSTTLNMKSMLCRVLPFVVANKKSRSLQ
jgi:hypothetical protein